MIVRTPAVKLAVELREAAIEGERLKLGGVANMMPCTVELSAEETRALIALTVRSLKPVAALRWLFSKKA